MADIFGFSALPGPGGVMTTEEACPTLGPDDWYMLKGVVINSVATDAGNTPTTQLRPGLLMGQRTSDGTFSNYNPAGTDGTQLAQGILWQSRSTVDDQGNPQNRTGQILIAGYFSAAAVILLDEQARRQMHGRAMFDDRLVGPSGGFKETLAKTASYNVVAGQDNDTHFTTTGAAAAVQFTLPAPARGNRFRFTNTVAQTMEVSGPANTLVVPGNAAATNITFSTAGAQIGADVEVCCDDTGTKWLTRTIGGTATYS